MEYDGTEYTASERNGRANYAGENKLAIRIKRDVFPTSLLTLG